MPTWYYMSDKLRIILSVSKNMMLLSCTVHPSGNNNFEQMLKSYMLKNFSTLWVPKTFQTWASHCREGERALPGLKEPY